MSLSRRGGSTCHAEALRGAPGPAKATPSSPAVRSEASDSTSAACICPMLASIASQGRVLSCRKSHRPVATRRLPDVQEDTLGARGRQVRGQDLTPLRVALLHVRLNWKLQVWTRLCAFCHPMLTQRSCTPASGNAHISSRKLLPQGVKRRLHIYSQRILTCVREGKC